MDLSPPQRRPSPLWFCFWWALFMLAGLQSAAMLPPPKPWWSLVYLTACGATHALLLCTAVLAVAALLLRTFAALPARIAAALLVTTAMGMLALDALSYSFVGQHAGAGNLVYLLKPKTMTFLGIQPGDAALFAGMSGALFAAAALTLPRATRALRFRTVLALAVALDLLFAVANAAIRHEGLKPVIGLDEAMPLALRLPLDGVLTRVLGPAQSYDEEVQFPLANLVGETQRSLALRPLPSTIRDRPDVLLVLVESLRADALAEMPHLRALQERSVAADLHYSGGNCTFLGMTSILSGLEAPAWRARGLFRAPQGVPALKALGYDVVWLDSGVVQYRMPETMLPPGDVHVVGGGAASPLEQDEQNTRFLAETWPREKRDRPSMAVLILEGTHWPYWPKDDPPAQLSLVDSWEHRSEAPQYKARYLKAVREADARIGRMLDGLRAAGREESTVVIVTGDHGEAFREHGVLGHGTRLDDEQLRVPFAMRLPGVAPRRLSTPTSHSDVLPTLLRYLGASPLDAAGAQGVDMLADAPRPGPLLVGNCFSRTGFAAVQGDEKLLFLFDGERAHFVSRLGRGETLLSRQASAADEKLLKETAARMNALYEPLAR